MSDEPDGPSEDESVLRSASCPRCASELDAAAPVIRCADCGQSYPRLGHIPVLLSDPDSWLALWRVQLDMVERQAQGQFAGIEAQLRFGDAIPETTARVGAMLSAARQQIADIRGVLGPLLPLGARQLEKGANIKSPLEQIHYLFRDWGWDGGQHAENESAFRSIEKALNGAAVGRMLVLGAGACRLTYDLHRRCGAKESVALDIDPLLLAVAHQVVRGEKVPMTEASISVHETESASRRWELRAPSGPIDESELHFVLADGLAPPFAPETFDTVVTPWFTDRIPPDLRDFLGVVEMLLKPEGRWINFGPLLYPPELPLERRFAREELFALAERAGFRIDTWSAESGPHLLSPYHGRGRVEWLLTFVATKRDSAETQADERMPPSWLVLPYLPVPTFEGQSVFIHQEPLVSAVIAAIDGDRSVNDLTQAIVDQIRDPNVDARVVRDNVRRALAVAHPGCRRST
jgi:SAM-dependent methyltransferase